MKNSAEKIAIIDIGSNSVRLFIFDVSGALPEQIVALKYFCGLGKDLGTTGNLNPEAVAMTHGYLVEFRKEIDKHSIDAEIVIGTAALREAKDAGAFLKEVKDISGFDVKIIEGEEEARLAALAVLSASRHASGIVADFGGGSLELAKIGNGEIEKKVSLRLGAHYLKALSDPKTGIDLELAAMIKENSQLVGAERLFIIGGSWRSLAKACLEDRGRNNKTLEGVNFRAADMVDFCESVRKTEPEDLIVRYRMEPPRAYLMDVSALMLARLIESLEPDSVEVSTAGIRDGLAYDYILKRQS